MNDNSEYPPKGESYTTTGKMKQSKKKCSHLYGAKITENFINNQIRNITIEFVEKGKAAIYYFNYCPNCGGKL